MEKILTILITIICLILITNITYAIENLPKEITITGFSEITQPTEEIYINESEFYKGKIRNYEVGLPGGSYYPMPLKGATLNSYFKSLNLREDYIYALIQFDTLSGNPTNEQRQVLLNDNITLFDWTGDKTYYAKSPRSIIESKSYSFVRWMGIIENSSLKIDNSNLRWYYYKNCTGPINLTISFYENLNDKQYQQILQLSNGIVGYWTTRNFIPSNHDSIDLGVNIDKLKEISSLNFVKKISGPGVIVCIAVVGAYCPEYDPFENITCTNLG